MPHLVLWTKLLDECSVALNNSHFSALSSTKMILPLYQHTRKP